MFLADDTFFNDPEFRQMLKTFEEAASQGTPPFLDADELIDIADYYRMTDQTEKAIAVAKSAITLFPHATLPNVFMARSALREYDLERAQHYVSMIEEHDDPDYLYIKAELLLFQYRTEEANQLLTTYFNGLTDEDNGWFIKDVVNLYLDYEEYTDGYNWLMKYTDEKDSDYQDLLGRALYGIGQPEKGEQIFTQLTDQYPFEKRYWKMLADIQLAQHKTEAAITSSEYAIAIDPDDPAALNIKASALMEQENWQEAEEYFQMAIELRPTEGSFYLNRATCLIHYNDFDETIACLQDALDNSSDALNMAGSIYHQMALCHGALGNVETAKLLLKQSEKHGFIQSDIYIARGHIAQIERQYAEADRYFNKALAVAASPTDALVRIAVSMTDCRRFKKCLTLLKKKLPVTDEQCVQGISLMALCCLNLQLFDDFLYYLQLAAERNPIELRAVLGDYFPENMAVEDYYRFAYQHIYNPNQPL